MNCNCHCHAHGFSSCCSERYKNPCQHCKPSEEVCTECNKPKNEWGPNCTSEKELCGCEADEWGIEHTIEAHGIAPHSEESWEVEST